MYFERLFGVSIKAIFYHQFKGCRDINRFKSIRTDLSEALREKDILALIDEH